MATEQAGGGHQTMGLALLAPDHVEMPPGPQGPLPSAGARAVGAQPLLFALRPKYWKSWLHGEGQSQPGDGESVVGGSA